MNFARQQEYNQHFTDLHEREAEFENEIESRMEEFDLTYDESIEQMETKFLER